jgi:23S rRNA pseudouridine2605 synthase
LLEALDVSVLRLIRVAIGALPLGALAKGRWRMLSQQEIDSLVGPRNSGPRRVARPPGQKAAG